MVNETEAPATTVAAPTAAAAKHAAHEPGTSLYVGNLPFFTKWYELKDLFRECGEIAFCDIPQDRSRSQEQGRFRNRGFGIVRYESVEGAQAAIEKFNEFEFNGRNLVVRLDEQADKRPVKQNNGNGATEGSATERTERPARQQKMSGPAVDVKTQVFVSNLSWSVEGKDLLAFAKEQGLEPTKADVMSTATGRSLGRGLIAFASEAAALEAVEKLQGLELQDRALEARQDQGAKKYAPRQ